ncbi:hypothetical protein M5689_013009 [Euphorbia peplus]|nr:hypothetical protein M5689_013009 [Euphorbia peplus]
MFFESTWGLGLPLRTRSSCFICSLKAPFFGLHSSFSRGGLTSFHDRREYLIHFPGSLEYSSSAQFSLSLDEHALWLGGSTKIALDS